jgi:hypothetical protein
MIKLTNRTGKNLNMPTLRGYLGGMTTTPSGPTVLILDQFTDTDGTLFSAHTIAPTNTPGTAWTNYSGALTLEIASNRVAIPAAGGNGRRLYAVNSGVSNGVCSFDIVVGAASRMDAFGVLRLSNATNYFLLGVENGDGGVGSYKLVLYSVEAGVITQRAITNIANVSNTTQAITATMSGNSISWAMGIYSNSYSSAFNSTATNHGTALYKDATFVAQNMDNFQVTTL